MGRRCSECGQLLNRPLDLGSEESEEWPGICVFCVASESIPDDLYEQ